MVISYIDSIDSIVLGLVEYIDAQDSLSSVLFIEGSTLSEGCFPCIRGCIGSSMEYAGGNDVVWCWTVGSIACSGIESWW